MNRKETILINLFQNGFLLLIYLVGLQNIFDQKTFQIYNRFY